MLVAHTTGSRRPIAAHERRRTGVVLVRRSLRRLPAGVGRAVSAAVVAHVERVPVVHGRRGGREVPVPDPGTARTLLYWR